MLVAKAVAEKPIEAPSFSRDDYNRIAASAAIRDIKLITSKFDIQPAYFNQIDDVKLQIDSSIETVNFVEGSGLVIAIFSYEVRGLLKRKRVLHSKASFLTVYDVPEDAIEEAAKAFCNRVGFFAAYPYFRALSAHFADLSGAELPILPVLSSAPIKRDDQNTDGVD